MLHPKATIQRPPATAFDTSNVIKADQFPSWHGKFVEGMGIGNVLKSALNMRGMDTIKEWAEKLKRQHRKADLLTLPDFMQPKQPAPPVAPTVKVVTELSMPTTAAAVPEQRSAPAPVVAAATSEKRLVCTHCRRKISFPEGKFCWNNSVRFGGHQYCREHQALF